MKKLTAVTDQLKADSSALAKRMREDINNSYRLELQDLKLCITGLCSNLTSPAPTSNKSPDSATSKAEYKDDWIEVLLKSKFNFLKDWDIRSLSRRETAVTEEPQAENKPEKEAPLSSPKSSPKEAESASGSKPKKAEPVIENKPKKVERAAENKSGVAESKPKKDNASPEGNSKK